MVFNNEDVSGACSVTHALSSHENRTYTETNQEVMAVWLMVDTRLLVDVVDQVDQVDQVDLVEHIR